MPLPEKIDEECLVVAWLDWADTFTPRGIIKSLLPTWQKL